MVGVKSSLAAARARPRGRLGITPPFRSLPSRGFCVQAQHGSLQGQQKRASSEVVPQNHRGNRVHTSMDVTHSGQPSVLVVQRSLSPDERRSWYCTVLDWTGLDCKSCFSVGEKEDPKAVASDFRILACCDQTADDVLLPLFLASLCTTPKTLCNVELDRIVADHGKKKNGNLEHLRTHAVTMDVASLHVSGGTKALSVGLE